MPLSMHQTLLFMYQTPLKTLTSGTGKSERRGARISMRIRAVQGAGRGERTKGERALAPAPGIGGETNTHHDPDRHPKIASQRKARRQGNDRPAGTQTGGEGASAGSQTERRGASAEALAVRSIVVAPHPETGGVTGQDLGTGIGTGQGRGIGDTEVEGGSQTTADPGLALETDEGTDIAA